MVPFTKNLSHSRKAGFFQVKTLRDACLSRMETQTHEKVLVFDYKLPVI